MKPDYDVSQSFPIELSQESYMQILKSGAEAQKQLIITLLDENQKCRLDGGHDTQGYCFCIARQLIKGENK